LGFATSIIYDGTPGIEQSVAVSASKPYLSYWFWIASSDFCGYVMVDQVVVDRLDLCSDKSTNGWKRRTVNLSAYKGQIVSLALEASTDGSRNSNWFVDDLRSSRSPSLDIIGRRWIDG
jgi:hypothetical protein